MRLRHRHWSDRRRERGQGVAMPIIVSLFGAGLVGLLIYGVTHQAASRTLDDAIAHGAHPLAPQRSHRLPVLAAGGDSSLAAYRGKVVVLNFWASWCPPCIEEAPLMESVQHRLEGRGATVLGVTYEDNSSDSERFVKHYGLTYPNLRDIDGEFAHSYGTDLLPESFLINRQGDVVAISRHVIDKTFTERALALARST